MHQVHTLLTAIVVLLAVPAGTLRADHSEFPTCSKTARTLKAACSFDIRDDYLETVAICLNGQDLWSCLGEAGETFREDAEECREVHAARREVCEGVGEAPYQPAFGNAFAASFVDPLDIGGAVAPNPYFPLIPGNYWVYQSTFEDDGELVTETITVEVTSATKLIDGVTCIVVVDTGEEDGEPVEITDDWYAQDMQGNVYYCGEISRNFELFDGDEPQEPELVDIEGSWKHGREGAKAGVLLPALPMPGELHRQEVAWGDAEDVVEILRLDADESVTLADGSVLPCAGACLQTRDFSPLEPDAEENKYYLPGLGLILEVDLEEETRVELKEYGNRPL
jgi:hypothetical protein